LPPGKRVHHLQEKAYHLGCITSGKKCTTSEKKQLRKNSIAWSVCNLKNEKQPSF